MNKIFKSKGFLELLLQNIQQTENIPVVTYNLLPTIRNKIFNYKETVSTIKVDDEVSFSSATGTCDCKSSTFCDADHQHIITGDLRIIANTKLRKLLSKGPNFREPNTINYGKCKISLETGIEDCIGNLISKYKLNDNDLNNWRAYLKNEISKRIKTLRKNNNFYKPIFLTFKRNL